MKGYVNFFDDRSKLIKILLSLPILHLVWSIYRTIKSLMKESIIGVILSILLIFPFEIIMWLVDLITIIIKNKILWIN